MDGAPRFTNLLPLWSWLPAFRAIAETEHLPTAARLCGTGPSSLSRSLGQLERALGRALFARDGRNLRLNEQGRVLLAAVRDAMRRLDDGVEELHGTDLRGAFTIGSSGAGTTTLVAPALERLRTRHPELRPALVTHAEHDAAAMLLRGELDVAFQERPAQRAGVVVRAVGALQRSVYCGHRHPLFAAARVSADDVLRAGFVAPPPDADGVRQDGWPAAHPRNVVVQADQLRVGLELCVDQPLLAVLPDALAATRARLLRRLPQIEIAAAPVYALHREVFGPRPSAAVELTVLVATGAGA